MLFSGIPGVPDFVAEEFHEKNSDYCVLIPILNEAGRIEPELIRAQEHSISNRYDILICDAKSTDGCTNESSLRILGVNTLLTKHGEGKQGAQLRMGFWWAIQRGYKGFVTIDGNNKDSIEDVPRFIEKLEEGYDFVQGSRFIKGGKAVNTPLIRDLAIKYIHAPIISITAKQHFTDTTNAFRAYSRKYIEHPLVQPFRDVFLTYELLAYLSVRASQVGLRVCEVPVKRSYPKGERIPTKITLFKGSNQLLMILINNLKGRYNP